MARKKKTKKKGGGKAVVARKPRLAKRGKARRASRGRGKYSGR